MIKPFCLLLALVSFSFALPRAAVAMTIERVSACGGYVLRLRGDVRDGDHRRFKAQFAKGPVIGIDVSSRGGIMEEGMPMAKLVLKKRLPVYAAGECDSMCAVMFFAGARRYLGKDGRIGVHSISNEKAREQAESMVLTLRLARYLASEMAVPDAAIGKMVLTRPGRIAYLDATDLSALKTQMRNPFESTAIEMADAEEARPHPCRDIAASAGL
jgi:hypothetical protein